MRNLSASPEVRVRLRGRWQRAMFRDDKHAALVQKFGTSLLTIRVDLQ